MTEDTGAEAPVGDVPADEPAFDPLAFLADLESRGASLKAHETQILRRLTLDPQAAVWMPACGVLGALAHRDGDSYLALQELLHCPLPELRLRGVTALAPLAADRPDEVVRFVEESLGMADDRSDAILLQATLALLPHLPEELGRSILVNSLFDARVAVRAAAVGSLAGWEEWPPDVSARLAEDPSSLVRAALVEALGRRPESDETGLLWETLAAAPEPYFRAYLAAELRGLVRADGRAVLEALAEDACELVRDAARGRSTPSPERAPEQPPTGLDEVRALEQVLDASPDAILETLRAVMAGPDATATLETLSYLCRDALAARLCRALQQLVGPSTEKPADRLNATLDLLANCSGDHPATAFKRFLMECARALPVRSTEEALTWATFVQTDLGSPGMATTERALAWLVDAAGLLGSHELAAAAAALDEAASRIDADYPEPERGILRMVARAWAEMVDAEIDDAFASVNE